MLKYFLNRTRSVRIIYKLNVCDEEDYLTKLGFPGPDRCFTRSTLLFTCL